MKRTQSVKTVGWAVAVLALGTAGVLLQPTRAQSIAGGADNSVTGPGEGGGGMPSCNKGSGQENREDKHPSPPAPPPSPEEVMIGQLNLTPDQQAQVKAIFETEREQMRTVHQQTQQLLARVLTDAQLQQLSTMPPPPPPRPGRPTQQNTGQTQNKTGAPPKPQSAHR
jgi:Spy/CpxP family protein refolding chaperone